MQLRQKWRLLALAIASMLFIAACTSPPSQAPEAAVAEPVADVVDAVDTVEVIEDVAEEAEPTEAEAEEANSSPAEVVSENESVSAATEKGEVDTSRYDDFEIITLLPPDAIPSIDNPTFHTAAEADDFYEPDELVMGVVFNGDARAYSVPHLSSHEIVNDEVGGVKIAVTW